MARYVILEFDDNDTADRFISKLGTVSTFRVIGLFFKPTNYCRCGAYSDAEVVRKVKRHKKFGVWVCRTCGLTRPGPQSPRNIWQNDKRHGPFISTHEEGKLIPNHPFLEAHN